MMTGITTNKLRLMEHIKHRNESLSLADAVTAVQEHRVALLSAIAETLETHEPLDGVDSITETVTSLSQKLSITTDILTKLRVLTAGEVFNQAMGVSNTDD